MAMVSNKINKEEFNRIIMEKVAGILSSERFKAFLMTPDTLTAFRAQVLEEKPYSFGNYLALALFGCSAVAGFQTWKKLGYFVKKGSKSIPIYKPLIVKRDPDDLEGEDAGDGKKLIGFGVARVFDVSQVQKMDGLGHEEEHSKVEAFFKRVKEAQNFCLELQGGDAAQAASLQQWIEQTYPVEFKEIVSGARGCTNGVTITLREGMAPAQVVKTMIHEFAHCRLGHPGNGSLSRESKEVQAETAAFIASRKMGLDTSDHSFDYLAAWGKSLMESEDGASKFREDLALAIEEGERIAEEYQTFLTAQPLPVPQAGEERIQAAA